MLLKLILASALLLQASGCGGAGADLGKAREKVDAFERIDKLRKEKPVDFDKISKIYSQFLAGDTKSYDKDYELRMDGDITAAIDMGRRKKDVSANVEVIAKTIMRVLYILLVSQLEDAGTANNARKKKQYIEKARIYYGGLRAMVKRRGKWIGAGDELDNTITKSFARLEKSAGKDRLEFMTGKNTIIDTLKKSIALSVLYEMVELVKYRKNNSAKIPVKFAEGLTYYSIIKQYVSENSPDSDRIISDFLTGPADIVDPKIIEKELTRGLSGLKLR